MIELYRPNVLSVMVSFMMKNRTVRMFFTVG